MSTLATCTSTTIEEPARDRFMTAATSTLSVLGDQLVVSQSRCVDQVLDLYNATEEPAVRSTLAEFLSEIRHLSAVPGRRLREAIDLAVAASHVELAYAGLVLRLT